MNQNLSAEILFDEYGDEEYVAGKMMGGKVIINALEEVSLKCIIICIRGVAAGKLKIRNQIVHRLPFDKQEPFKTFHQKKVILKEDNRMCEKRILKLGANSFHWRFHLPRDVPSSFYYKHPCIHVHYWCELKVIGDSNEELLSLARPFHVKRHLDLNQDLGLSDSVTYKKCLSLGEDQTIKIFASINSLSFIAGEELHASANIVNKSLTKISKVCFSLQQYVELEISDLKNRVVRVITTDTQDGVQCHKEKTVPFRYHLPSLLISRFDGCDFIDIRYFLEIKLEPKITCLYIPITIGSIPFSKPFNINSCVDHG